MAAETAVVQAGRGGFRALLRNRRFRLLWVSQFVSGVGDWLVIGFLMPLVTSLSGGSSFAVAGIMIAKIIPSLMFSSVIGALIDRFDRRRVMIACDVVRAVLALGLLVTNSLAAIYLIVLVMEVASLFFYPAKSALIPHLVDEDHLAEANGLSYTTQQASMLIGLTASGAILAGFEVAVRALLSSGFPLVNRLVGLFAPELLGPRAGVFLDTLTFVFSAACIALIRVQGCAGCGRPEFEWRLVGRDAIESFTFLGEHRELRAFLIAIGLAILGGGAIIPVGLVYVQQNLTGTVPFLDMVPVIERLMAARQTFMLVLLAFGMTAGALVAPRLSERLRLQVLFSGSIAAFGLAMLGFASVGLYWLAAIFAVVAGAAVAVVSVAGNTYVVRTVDDSIRGRVFTSLESVIRVALLVSMVVVAPLGDVLSGVVQRIVVASGVAPADVMFTGSRLTLQSASLIVLGAAVFAYVTLWRRSGREVSQVTEPRDVGLPGTAEAMAALTCGEAVTLSGVVYVARDATHARLSGELERDGVLPYGLAGQVLFYAGPTPPAAGRPAGAVGPTTSRRMDGWTPELLAAGVTATIGKGPRSEAVRAACAEHGAVYFAVVGGAAALLARHVTAIEPVAYPELGPEALVRMTLDEMPAFVAIDARGCDMYAGGAR
ncbi:MAG: hypothetical protein C0418_02120 [Coriobacteriaceae bacterium]|nr:hypothetical protein [Coriobacteriaceae bacterium]